MVDVERRMPTLSHSHAAGLRRLSARAHNPKSNSAAAASTSSASSTPSTRSSFDNLAAHVVSHLRNSGVPLDPGLSEVEFERLEAQLGFTFPPDLRALLRAAVPVGPGFPYWRSSAISALRMALCLPLAAISYNVAAGTLWLKAWGHRPADAEAAIRVARAAVKKAPVLIPLYGHCYIPSSPCIAGNPVFFVDQTRVSCFGSDLADFFDRGTALLSPLRRQRSLGRSEEAGRRGVDVRNFRRRSDSSQGRIPRWIEFWSDVVDPQRNSGSASPERLFSSSKVDGEIRRPVPNWVGGYLKELSGVLRGGGWDEDEIEEVFDEATETAEVAAMEIRGEAAQPHPEAVFFDSQAVLDGLLLKADSLSNSLRRAGWSSQEVSDALGFDCRPTKPRKPAKNLPPDFLERIGRLAECIPTS